MRTTAGELLYFNIQLAHLFRSLRTISVTGNSYLNYRGCTLHPSHKKKGCQLDPIDFCENTLDFINKYFIFSFLYQTIMKNELINKKTEIKFVSTCQCLIFCSSEETSIFCPKHKNAVLVLRRGFY